jgi:hypothetical protein
MLNVGNTVKLHDMMTTRRATMRIEVDSTNNAKGELAPAKFRMDGVDIGVVEISNNGPAGMIISSMSETHGTTPSCCATPLPAIHGNC